MKVDGGTADFLYLWEEQDGDIIAWRRRRLSSNRSFSFVLAPHVMFRGFPVTSHVSVPAVQSTTHA